jgi:hypothetical protein
MALDGLGCSLSHTSDMERVEPDGLVPPSLRGPRVGRVAAPDGSTDGGGPTADAGDGGDGGNGGDGGDGAFDAGASDAEDPRFCESGWPTTKASFCVTLEERDDFLRVECCSSFVEDPSDDACCIWEGTP